MMSFLKEAKYKIQKEMCVCTGFAFLFFTYYVYMYMHMSEDTLNWAKSPYVLNVF